MEPEIQIDRSGTTEEMLCTVTNLLLCMTWLISLESLYRDNPGQIAVCALSAGAFVLYEEWSALRVRHLFWYAAGHAAIYVAAAALLFTGTLPVDILTMVFLVVMTGMGLHARLRAVTFFRPKWQLFLSGIVQFAIGYGSGRIIALRTGQVSIAAAALLCIIWYNHASIRGVLEATHTKATVPYEQIRINNRFALLLSIGIVAAITLPVLLLTSGEDLFRILLRAGIFLLRGLVQIFVYIFGSNTENASSETASQGAGDFDMSSLVEETENPFLDAFWEVMTAALSATVVLVILWALLRVLKQFRQDFNRSGQMDGDRIEYLRPEERRKDTAQSGAFSAWLRGRTPRIRIRRMYQKAIRSAAQEGSIKKSHTPQELEAAAFGSRASEAGEKVHRMYEKARYGKEESSAGDASLMKEQLRKLGES